METRKYIDVNIFVYWLGAHPEYGERACEWIKKVELSERGEYYTSALTLYELGVIIAGLADMNMKDKDFISEIVVAITSLVSLTVEPLKVEDYSVAYELMGYYNLDLEDALHLSTAQRVDAEKIITNDMDFSGTFLDRSF